MAYLKLVSPVVLQRGLLSQAHLAAGLPVYLVGIYPLWTV